MAYSNASSWFGYNTAFPGTEPSLAPGQLQHWHRTPTRPKSSPNSYGTVSALPAVAQQSQDPASDSSPLLRMDTSVLRCAPELYLREELSAKLQSLCPVPLARSVLLLRGQNTATDRPSFCILMTSSSKTNYVLTEIQTDEQD